jgi:hypothetical protein
MERNKTTNRLLRVPGYAAIKADSLVRFLNTPQPEGDVEHFRVMAFLGFCQELNGQPAGNTVQRRALIRNINSHLEEFVFAVRLGFNKGDVFSEKYVLNWRQSPYPRASHSRVAPPVTGRNLGTVSPSIAVIEILEMQTAGTLDRIRKCQCGQWFFARSNKKAVCSDACRVAKFKQSSATYKEDCAKYMRKYRKDRADAKAKAKAKRREALAKKTR